ncbi:phosphopantetheine-binding protein [Chitinophaga sp. 22321]|uniref:Carrier domain-containing protein n=1 Tax=Chitinophaga hostae TaxID=2831022 RepID=A0ABS5J9L0_9BACT|nr:phosphopantetheine-binding protein [Chitinophaga hostae]MBS0031780.1 hypothetical protein [Chitinophaga hostae]
MKERFFNILRSYLKFAPEAEVFDWNEPLKNMGLDSMASINLVIVIEDEFGIIIPDEYLNAATFRSAATLYQMIGKVMDTTDTIK